MMITSLNDQILITPNNSYNISKIFDFGILVLFLDYMNFIQSNFFKAGLKCLISSTLL